MTMTEDILKQSKDWFMLVDGDFIYMRVKHGDDSYFDVVEASALWDSITDLDLTRKEVEIIVPSDSDRSGANYWARFLTLHRFKVKRKRTRARTREVGMALREWALRQPARSTYH